MKIRLQVYALTGLLILAGCGGSGSSSSTLGGGSGGGQTVITTTTTTTGGTTTTSTTTGGTTTTTSSTSSTTSSTSTTTTTTTTSTTSTTITPTGPSGPGTVKEFTIPNIGDSATGICLGPDNRVWFTENLSGNVGKIDGNGNLVEYVTGAGRPSGICTGPDGNLWVHTGPAIVRLTTSGVPTIFPRDSGSPPPNTSPALGSICVGPDGALWFTDAENVRIGRITTSGALTFFNIPGGTLPFTGPVGICAGPDGNLWFTCLNQRLGRVTPGGAITIFTNGISPGIQLARICSGPDGNLWFTGAAQRFYRATTSGGITEFAPTLAPASIVVGICSGPGGFLYFSEFSGPGVGRISTSGVATEFSGSTGNGSLDICVGPDNKLWFPQSGLNKIGVLTPP